MTPLLCLSSRPRQACLFDYGPLILPFHSTLALTHYRTIPSFTNQGGRRAFSCLHRNNHIGAHSIFPLMCMARLSFSRVTHPFACILQPSATTYIQCPFPCRWMDCLSSFSHFFIGVSLTVSFSSSISCLLSVI